MSNTKIVIDKEDWDKIASEFNSNDLPTVTEIQIDQSIEEISDKMHIEIARAKGQLLGIINGLNLKNEAEIGLKEVVSKLDLIQRYATSQQIIEQLRVKEKERPFPCMSDEICKEQCGACGYIQDKLTK